MYVHVTNRFDSSLDEVLLVREVEVRVVAIHLLAHRLHRNLLQISALEDLLHVFFDLFILHTNNSFFKTLHATNHNKYNEY